MATGVFALDNFQDDLSKIVRKGGRKVIDILATGRQATGKSAVINCLIGEEVATECSSLDQETSCVTKYNRNVDMIEFNVWDTPGIEANTENETEKFQSIADQVPNVDLLIFCTKMDETRLRKQDSDTIAHFTQAFGDEIWKHAVFALTFANKVVPAAHNIRNDPVARREFFKRRLQLWNEQLHNALRKSGVSEEVIQNVCIVPVGYKEQSLPDGSTEWLTTFWSACHKTMKESAQPALLKVNINRLKEAQTVTPEDYHLPVYRWPIILMTDTAKKVAVPAASGAVIGTAGALIAGPTGFAVGGTLGVIAGLGYLFRK